MKKIKNLSKKDSIMSVISAVLLFLYVIRFYDHSVRASVSLIIGLFIILFIRTIFRHSLVKDEKAENIDKKNIYFELGLALSVYLFVNVYADFGILISFLYDIIFIIIINVISHMQYIKHYPNIYKYYGSKYAYFIGLTGSNIAFALLIIMIHFFTLIFVCGIFEKILNLN